MRPCVTLTIDTVCIQQKKKDFGKILWIILWLYLFYIFCAIFWYLMDFCKIYCAKTRLRWTLPVTVKNIELCDAHCGGKLKPRLFHHSIHFFWHQTLKLFLWSALWWETQHRSKSFSALNSFCNKCSTSSKTWNDWQKKMNKSALAHTKLLNEMSALRLLFSNFSPFCWKIDRRLKNQFDIKLHTTRTMKLHTQMMWNISQIRNF